MSVLMVYHGDVLFQPILTYLHSHISLNQIFWTKVIVSNVFRVVPGNIVVKKTFKQAKLGHYQDVPSVMICTKDNLMQELSSKTPENGYFCHKMCIRVLRSTKIGYFHSKNTIFYLFRKLQFWLILACFSDFGDNFKSPNSLRLTRPWKRLSSGMP